MPPCFAAAERRLAAAERDRTLAERCWDRFRGLARRGGSERERLSATRSEAARRRGGAAGADDSLHVPVAISA